MAGYAESITRAMVPVPETVANEIIKEAPKASVSLTRMKQVRMSTKTMKQPVLSVLPDAYWVSGDTGLKQTSHGEWDQLTITAEEMAVLVPIPDALVDDASIPIWNEIRPLLVEAIGRKLDQATLFGVDKPASFPVAVVPGAIAAGNSVAAGAGTDYGVDVADVAAKVAADGYAVNGFAAMPGLNWKLIALRNATTDAPIYGPSFAEGQPGTLYGYPLNEVVNGAWQSGTAELIAADWSKFVIGVRQDITFKMLDQAVISDADGAVVFNAPQQDSQIMRVVFRVGFQVAAPVTRLNATAATRYPAGVLTTGSLTWVTLTAYSLGAAIKLAGGAVLVATTAGTTGASAPTAPGTVGGTVTDGTVVWTRVA